jgi:crotonobetainyl-CoA:carnitine CoA-transferase CaiB-like acyl-CoA transferase
VNPSSEAPLNGLRVVDLSRVLAGPYCTMMLADLGADVVKVERPGEGDETRSWGPPYAGSESAYYLSINRSKRSVALNLKDARALELAVELCAGADVVIENFRPGAADAMGLGFDALRSRNERLVYCSITGFGTDRRPPARPGYDFIAQAESGLMAITGDDEPMKVGVAMVDVMTGVHAAVGILAALHGGGGRRLEVPLLDTAIASLINVAAGALITGTEPRRFGNAHPHIVPYQPFRTADGWVAVAAANDGLFRRMCEAIGRAELAERYPTNASRVEGRDELIPQLEAVFATGSADDWAAQLDAAGVPAGKIRGVLDAIEAATDAGHDPRVSVDHPTIGELQLIGSPIRTDGLTQPAAPPLLGQHTAEVLGELGVAPDELEALKQRGAVA